MMEKLTLEELEAILIQVAGRDIDFVFQLTETTANQPLATLGFDSLALINIIVEIEQRCDARLPVDFFRGSKTPTEILDFLDNGNNGEAS